MDCSLTPDVFYMLAWVVEVVWIAILCRWIYNVRFHPLRSYPGPPLWAATRLPYTLAIFRGDVTHRVQDLHNKYGPVVRITPDSLSYTDGQAWKDIYALGPSGQYGNLPKDPKFYVLVPGGIENISTARDINHRRIRRLQAYAFSEKAIVHQEPYLLMYIKKFITSLRKEARRNNQIVDISQWVNILATDVIGDLTFGESFGGLDSGLLHPWLQTLFTTTKAYTFTREILRLPTPFIKAAMACIPKKMREHQEGALAFGAEAARRRLAQTTDRPDFMSYILRHNGDEGKGMSRDELDMAAITFIIAGSETVSTMLSGTIYLLLSNRSVLDEFTKTIRSDFPEESDLTNTALQKHEYLTGVLKEGLRLYPPTPDRLFRTTANQSVMIAGKMVPPHTNVTINLWAANRSRANFHEPLKFVPERWMAKAPPAYLYDDKDVFRPFSMGPRDCIGKNLAWAEIRLILAYLVWHFDFLGIEPDSKQWIERQKIFTLWGKLPLNVNIVPRCHEGQGEGALD